MHHLFARRMETRSKVISQTSLLSIMNKYIIIGAVVSSPPGCSNSSILCYNMANFCEADLCQKVMSTTEGQTVTVRKVR